jgi:molybdopterin/thiamine biosynthesis adenylyltransferase
MNNFIIILFSEFKIYTSDHIILFKVEDQSKGITLSSEQPQDRKALTEEERERTKRQKLIQGWDQETLKNACVFIAGVGALGCEIAKDLALMGVGKLMLCDMDKIETSNLSRQMLFYKGDEGRFKAECAAERLKLMNPYMETEVFTYPLQKIPMDKYKECDVVIAALDNVQARMDLNKFCIKLGIPMVEGGTVGFEGHVQVIVPETTKDVNGQPLAFGNKERIIDSIVDEMMWSLDEEKYKGFLNAKKDIEELEEKIEAIKATRIDPVMEELRKQAEDTLNADPMKYMNHTPCYRCVVPIPPPPQNQVAACTLKGVPRTREHCAIRGEVMFIKKHERKPDYDSKEDMKETLIYAQEELIQLRNRVLDENIPPEEKDGMPPEEIDRIKQNIFVTFGGDFELDDMENILGNKIPAIQSVSSIISSIESQEALKLIFLMNGRNIGSVMDPPYVNYNGVFGQFDQVPVSRREDCVACGQNQGQENAQVAIPGDSTVGDLFNAILQMRLPINKENWMITNPMTKSFIYNPMFEKGRTENQKLSDFEVKNGDELTFTPFGKEKEKAEIKQYNVVIQLL